MASSRGSTASSKPPKQRLAVTAQSATSKPWFTCSQPNSISCFQTEIVATHAKQRRTLFKDILRRCPAEELLRRVLVLRVLHYQVVLGARQSARRSASAAGLELGNQPKLQR